MKLKQILFSSFLLLSMGAYAVDVQVVPMSQQESAFWVKSLNRIVITNDADANTHIQFYDQELNSTEHAVTQPTKMVFGQAPTEGIDDVVVESGEIRFYPNPAKDYIHIVDLPSGAKPQLYTIQGQLVMTAASADISVSALSAGTYVLRIGDQCYKVLIR